MMIKVGTLKQRALLAVIAAVGPGRVLCAAAHGQTTAPTTAPAAEAPSRSAEAINADIKEQFEQSQDLLASPTMLTNADLRNAAAPKAIPIFKKLVADFNELEAVDSSVKEQVAPGRAEFTMLLALMGDPDAAVKLKQQASDPNPAVSLEGRSGQLMIAWFNVGGDETAAAKVVDDVEKLAKANPQSTALTGQLVQMSQVGAPSEPIHNRLLAIASDVMKNEFADQIKQQLASSKKLEELEGKPLTIAGKQLGDKDFSTAGWQGKVVLVDFWATWCGPCMAEMPRVQKMYADYHEKGLEVLGVSNDQSGDDLAKFVGENAKTMPWPQLFDGAAAEAQKWNPITTGFGINGIPTMFLIDKKGICRSVTAREKLEELIPKMLAE